MVVRHELDMEKKCIQNFDRKAFGRKVFIDQEEGKKIIYKWILGK
jgi:hypothetical protein